MNKETEKPAPSRTVIGGSRKEPSGDSALLDSNLTGDIMSLKILAFLQDDRKEIIRFSSASPAICEKFQLAKYYCLQHGTKLEINPQAKLGKKGSALRRNVNGNGKKWKQRAPFTEVCRFRSRSSRPTSLRGM